MRERISTDNVVKLIELTQVESDGIGHIVWSPDGTVFAVSGTRTARLYVGKFGSDPAHVLDTKVNGIAFSPDSKRMVSVGDNGAVKIWDISFIQFEIKECLSLAGHTGPVNTVVFSPDGKRFATGGADGLICIWNGTDDKPLAIFKGHERAVKSVDFAIRGNVLVSGGEEDNIRLWDAIAETEGTVFATHNGGVCDLCSNPPGTMIASAGCDGSVRLWDVLSGEQYAVIKAHDGGVNCIGFSPYGELLATGGQDNAVRLWDVQKILNSGKADITNAAIALENHEKPVLGLIFNPAGTLLASVSDDIVRLWSIMD